MKFHSQILIFCDKGAIFDLSLKCFADFFLETEDHGWF